MLTYGVEWFFDLGKRSWNMEFTVPVRVTFADSKLKPRVYTTLNQWRSEHPLLLIKSQQFQRQWCFCQNIDINALKLQTQQLNFPGYQATFANGPQRGQTRIQGEQTHTHHKWGFDPKTYAGTLPSHFTRSMDLICHHPTEPMRIVKGPTPRYAWSQQAGVAGLFHHTWVWAQGDVAHHWSHAAYWDWYSTIGDSLQAEQHARVSVIESYHLFGSQLTQHQWQQWRGDLYLKSMEEQMQFKLKHHGFELPQNITAVELLI
jgi:hypothetical protein